MKREFVFCFVFVCLVGFVSAGFFSDFFDGFGDGITGHAVITEDCSDVVGLYHFDGDAEDSSGKGNNGSVVGASSVDGKVGSGAFEFDGVGGYVDVAQTSGLPVYSPSNSYSISLWFNNANELSNRVLFSESSTTSATPIFILGTGYKSRSIAIHLRNSDSTFLSWRPSTTIITKDEWHHVVWVDNNGNAELYIDGNLDATDYDYTPSGTFDVNRDSIGVLQRSSLESYFNGSIDEVVIYNKVLTSSEVSELYNGGTGVAVSCGPVVPSCFDGVQNQDETGVDCGGVCFVCPDCGNNIKENGEECDGSDLGDYIPDCSNYPGFIMGTLSCYPADHAQECEPDTSLCIAPNCVDSDGDGRINLSGSDYECAQLGDCDDDDGSVFQMFSCNYSEDSCGEYTLCVGSCPIAPAEGPYGDVTCSDGVDNDCDGMTDGDDFGCQQQPENSYYIAENGDDNNNGSIGTPWATIKHAADNTGPGDTVYLRGGTYSETRIEFRGDQGHGGADGAWWTITSYPGEEAILTSPFKFRLFSVSYVRISNLHFVDSQVDIGRYTYGGLPRNHHIEVLGNRFTGEQPQYGAIIVIGDNHLIEDNVISITGGGGSLDHGIYLSEGNNNVLRGNVISGISGYGIHLYVRTFSDPAPHIIRNALVEGNVVSGSRMSYGYTVASGETSGVDGVVLRNNVAYNNLLGGMAFTWVGAYLRNIQVYNNIFLENKSGVSVGYRFGTINDRIENITIKNNIIESPNGDHVYAQEDTQNIVVENNLYPTTPKFGGSADDAAQIVGDPLFVDEQNFDFHLQEGSPAIDSGLSLLEVPFDFDGNLRPQGNGFDIGAYEYLSGELPKECIPNHPADLDCNGCVDQGGEMNSYLNRWFVGESGVTIEFVGSAIENWQGCN